MKRILALLTALVLPLSPTGTLRETQEASIKELPKLTAYALYECSTKQCIMEENADQEYAVAGLSKLPAILTLCQAFDEGALDASASITISKRSAAVPGPTAFLSENEQAVAEGLIKASVMIAAGDAITALAESAYGSESVFIDNIAVTLREADAAVSLTDCLGSESKLSSETLFRLGLAASMSQTYMQYSRLFLDKLTHLDGRETELVSANRMVRFYSGCDGLITGSSQEAGYCGVFHAVRNGMDLICVVIGARNASDRSLAAEILLNHGFSNYTAKRLAAPNTVIVPAIPVRKGAQKSVNLIAHETVSALLPRAGAKLTEEREVPEFLEAPVSAEEPLGSIRYLDETGKVAATVSLYADAAIERFGYFDILMKIITDFAR